MSKVKAKDFETTAMIGGVWGTNLQMLFYGVACVLFWSVLMNQLPFISSYFGGKKIFFYVPLVYGLSSNISRVILMILHSKYKRSTGVSLSQLVYLGGGFTALGMFLFALSIAMLSTEHPRLGFVLCMVISSIVGAFNSLLVTGGYALMALSPGRSGQFFLLGLTFTGIVTWPCMMGLRKFVGIFEDSEWNNRYIVALVGLNFTGVLCIVSMLTYKFKTSVNPHFVNKLSLQEKNEVSILRTASLATLPLTCLWLSRVFTFALYPGMISLWEPSVSNAFYTESEYQSFLLYLGPLSDTIGQLAYRYIPLFRHLGEKSLVVITLIRGAVLIPLFWMSSAWDGSGSILASDLFRCFLMFGFSFSMGINYSLGSTCALGRVSADPDVKYTVGVLISFAAMNGLFIGTLVGIAIKESF